MFASWHQPKFQLKHNYNEKHLLQYMLLLFLSNLPFNGEAKCMMKSIWMTYHGEKNHFTATFSFDHSRHLGLRSSSKMAIGKWRMENECAHDHIIVISLSYHCHIIFISWSYHYDISIISLSYHYHIIISSNYTSITVRPWFSHKNEAGTSWKVTLVAWKGGREHV